MNKLYYYLIIINIITMLIYGLDKLLAIKKLRRISEFSLFFLSFIGGPIGALIGMLLFRHKTKKIYFYIIDILSIILYLYIIIMIK